jgi:hypothetical protein
MSSGSHDTHAAADHDHAFDGEPTDELPADEPRTPGWLPVLGAALFAAAAVAFLITRDTPPKPAAPAPEPVAVAAPAPRPIAPLPQQRVAMPTPVPAGSGADAAMRRLTPDQMAALQKQIEAMKAKQGAAAAPTPAH